MASGEASLASIHIPVCLGTPEGPALDQAGDGVVKAVLELFLVRLAQEVALEVEGLV